MATVHAPRLRVKPNPVDPVTCEEAYQEAVEHLERVETLLRAIAAANHGDDSEGALEWAVLSRGLTWWINEITQASLPAPDAAVDVAAHEVLDQVELVTEDDDEEEEPDPFPAPVPHSPSYVFSVFTFNR